jgi:hypothetical protein
MEFQDILNFHLAAYVKSGASIVGRLGFLVSLFKDAKENGLNIEDYKKQVADILTIKFFDKSLDDLYEICILRDIEKAISLTGPVSAKPNKEEKIIVSQEVDEFPDDVPQVDMEAFRNRKEQVDFEFLKSLGTDMEYLKSLGYEE